MREDERRSHVSYIYVYFTRECVLNYMQVRCSFLMGLDELLDRSIRLTDSIL